jgi:hypothetical protein
MGVHARLTCVVLLAMNGCASTPSGPSANRLPTGTWGGLHVALAVSEAGAHLDFDCASGEISEPLTVDGDGKLAADGVYIRERPGPQRVGDEPPKTPARFTGKIDGDTLTFEVTLTESKQSVGTFSVTRGREPQVFKCR